MITQYVLGFMIDYDKKRLALIRKIRPDWQAGMLNGIGGHIEQNETPKMAMVREFQEETGVITALQQWIYYCEMRGINNDQSEFQVYVYLSIGNIDSLQTFTDEAVEICEVSRVFSKEEKTVGNLSWLIALAFDFIENPHPPKIATITY